MLQPNCHNQCNRQWYFKEARGSSHWYGKYGTLCSQEFRVSWTANIISYRQEFTVTGTANGTLYYNSHEYANNDTAQGFGPGSLPLSPKLWTPSIVVLTPHLYCQLTATSWPGRCGGCMTRRPSPSPGCSAGVPRTRATAWKKIRVILHISHQTIENKVPWLIFLRIDP